MKLLCYELVFESAWESKSSIIYNTDQIYLVDNKYPASENNITSPTTYGKEAYETYRKKEKHSKKERKMGRLGKRRLKW